VIPLLLDVCREMFTHGSLHAAKTKLLARQHDYFDWKVLQLGMVRAFLSILFSFSLPSFPFLFF
jgi:hypothetical protein